MAGWQQVLNHLVYNAEEHFDKLKYRLAYQLGGPDPIKIVPFRGYGDTTRLYLKGRVLEDQHETLGTANDTVWDNLLNMYRRSASDEVPFARVRARFNDLEQVVTADDEGYFEVLFHLDQPLQRETMWYNIELELLSPLSDQQKTPPKATGEVFVPPPTALFAVISDIDDTVIQTDISNLVKMARNIFLGNATTRLPFPGVAAFYRALLNGGPTNANNPLFYISSSPWNLYDLLSEFFRLQNISLGPLLFLRDWGISPDEILPLDNVPFKLATIHRLMDFYQDLPFILIGDTTQQDPEIYYEIVRLYPKRVLAVYIRNPGRTLKHARNTEALAKKVVEAGSTLILADDTLALAKHAAQQGWIDSHSLPEISGEKQKDEAPPTPLETLLGEDPKAEGGTVVVKPESAPAAVEPAPGVDKEAIKQALDTGDKKTEKPPTVIIEPKDEDKNVPPVVPGEKPKG